MTHFLTLVLVEPADPDPLARAGQLMKPYWAPDFFDEESGERLPNVKCDGFTVGGRYDGIIWGKEQHHDLTPEQFQRRYGLDVVRPEDNLRPVAQLVPDLLPYAIVSSDGQWFDRADQPESAWRDTVRALLGQYRHQVAVAIDCHC